MKRLIPIFIFVFVANTLLAYDFKQKQICYSIMTLGKSDTLLLLCRNKKPQLTTTSVSLNWSYQRR